MKLFHVDGEMPCDYLSTPIKANDPVYSMGRSFAEAVDPNGPTNAASTPPEITNEMAIGLGYGSETSTTANR